MRIEETALDLVDGAPTAGHALAVVANACQRRLTTADRLLALAAARSNARWHGSVMSALEDVATGAHSLLELRYLRDVERRHGLPAGRRQRPVERSHGRQWTDISYEFATVVELDGRLGHDDAAGRWRDMRRDNAAALAGEASLRYGWPDVTRNPCAVAGQVAAVLRARGWTGRPRRCGKSCTL